MRPTYGNIYFYCLFKASPLEDIHLNSIESIKFQNDFSNGCDCSAAWIFYVQKYCTSTIRFGLLEQPCLKANQNGSAVDFNPAGAQNRQLSIQGELCADPRGYIYRVILMLFEKHKL